MNIQQLRENKQAVLAITGLALLALVLVTQPVFQSAAKLDKEIRVSKGKLNKYRLLLAKKNSLPEQFRITAAGGKQTITGVLIELEKLALADSVKINDMRPETIEGQNPVITIRTEATIRNYIGFFYHLERSGLYLGVKRLQLNARPNTDAVEGMCALDFAGP